MRIGLFSDTYLPTVNGISYVLQIMQARLEELGHEVYIFAPATNLRGVEAGDNDHVFRFPAIEGVFFDEQLTSVFFPPTVMRKIKKMNLDIVHIFTPSQIGLMGVYAAIKEDIPLVAQYSTDVYHYVEKYPNVLPGTVALGLTLPFFLKLTPREFVKLMTIFKPKKDVTTWHKTMIAKMHVALHDSCDAVIALSKKMQLQLDSWGSKTEATLLPTGIDALPEPTAKQVSDLQNSLGITKDDVVLTYAGRLSREKNLDLILDSFAIAARKQANLKLVFVGDFDYREELEARAQQLHAAKQIHFLGRMPRHQLGLAYALSDIFLFPSTTDTQGLVLHEAASAGLPLILCDPDVSEVFIDGQTGLLANNEAEDFAAKILELSGDAKLRRTLGKQARLRASHFGELSQMKKLETLYQKCMSEHKKIIFAGQEW